MGPNVRAAKEYPAVSWTDWDSVQKVKHAIRGLEAGQFESAAQVVDAMGRDDRIDGCLMTRAGALPSLPLSMEARGDGRRKSIAEEAEEGFEAMFPDHSLTDLAQWGIMLGVGVGELIWEFGDTRYTPTLKVWHPRFLSWRWDTRSFWLATEEDNREIHPGDGQWVLFMPYGAQRGWMHGKVRSLYVPWLIRQWGLRDWARYSEVHGMPIRKAVTPPNAAEEDKARFLQEVANLGNESIIRTPRVSGGTGEEPHKYDIELVEAMSQSWDGFEHLLDKAESCIAINLLGQNLTTEVKGGSYAAARMHMKVRDDVLDSDGERLGQCIREQALSWWALHNFGSKDLAPMPIWKTAPPEDKVEKGNALKSLGEGIKALQSVGAHPDVNALLEKDEIPFTEPAGVPPPSTPAAPGGEGPRSSPPQRPVAKASAAEDVPKAAIEGQLYADAIVEEGKAAASTALKVDVAALIQVIESSADFDQLKAALVRVYGEMDSEKLAELMQYALILAELGGRHAVLEEVKP